MTHFDRILTGTTECRVLSRTERRRRLQASLRIQPKYTSVPTRPHTRADQVVLTGIRASILAFFSNNATPLLLLLFNNNQPGRGIERTLSRLTRQESYQTVRNTQWPFDTVLFDPRLPRPTYTHPTRVYPKVLYNEYTKQYGCRFMDIFQRGPHLQLHGHTLAAGRLHFHFWCWQTAFLDYYVTKTRQELPAPLHQAVCDSTPREVVPCKEAGRPEPQGIVERPTTVTLLEPSTKILSGVGLQQRGGDDEPSLGGHVGECGGGVPGCQRGLYGPEEVLGDRGVKGPSGWLRRTKRRVQGTGVQIAICVS